MIATILNSLSAWFDSAFCTRLTLALVHFLWQGFVVAIVFAIIHACLRKASANARYLTGVAALLVMLSCVPMTLCLLAPTAAEPPIVAVAPVEPGVAVPENELPGNIPLPEDVFVPPNTTPAPRVEQPNAEWSWHDVRENGSRSLAWLSPYASSVYMCGVLVMLLRFAVGLWGGQRLRWASTRCQDSIILQAVAAQARRFGMRIVPEVAWCWRLSAPVVIGIWRPMILLPTALASGLTPDQLQAVLVHELAHVRRYDLAVNILQRLIESLLFFHPAIWWISRRVSLERENACDDFVLASHCQPVQYAEALVRAAELCTAKLGTRSIPEAALAATGGNASQLKRRVLRLLGQDDSARFRLSNGAILLLLLAFISLAVIPAVVHTQERNTKNDFTSEQQVPDAERQAFELLKKALHLPRLTIYDPEKQLSLFNPPESAWPLLAQLISLQNLQIDGTDLRGAVLKKLQTLTNLRRIEINHNKFTPLELEYLANFTKLEHLQITFTVLEESDDWLNDKLGALKPEEQRQLERWQKGLKISPRLSRTAILTDRALQNLVGLEELKSIELVNTFLTNSGIHKLAQLKSLEVLDVPALEFNDETLRLLKNIPRLRTLRSSPLVQRETGGDKWYDSFYAGLSTMPNLVELDFTASNVTDQNAEVLAKLSNLEVLGIRGNIVSDRGLESLSQLKRLRLLDLRWSEQSTITDTGIAAFKELHPECEVKVGCELPPTLVGERLVHGAVGQKAHVKTEGPSNSNGRETNNSRDSRAKGDIGQTGKLSGRFIFDGVSPKPKEIDIGLRKVLDESLVVGSQGGVANVFVWIRSADVPVSPAAELEPVHISMNGDRYLPHAVAFRAPRVVRIKNESDFGFVPKYSGQRSTINLPVAVKGQLETGFRPESMPVVLSASIHPWLSAWLLPLPHPYFSVSDSKGEIRIDDIPLGKWEFQVWHERTGYLNAKDWQKGRFTLEIKPGTNDLGLVLLDPAIFKPADDAEATAQPAAKTDATMEQSAKTPDDINVRYSRAVARIAKLAWEKAVAADRDAKGSISQLEIKKLKLEFHKAELQVEKAIRELSRSPEAPVHPPLKAHATEEQSTDIPDDLDVRLARATAGIAKLAWEKAVTANRIVKNSVSSLEVKKLELEFHKAELQVEKAILDQKIARLKAEVNRLLTPEQRATNEKLRGPAVKSQNTPPQRAEDWKIPTNMGIDEQSGRQYIDKVNELNLEVE
jgi:beta-lactamase regulating signal transducer with metallopeptidase domain